MENVELAEVVSVKENGLFKTVCPGRPAVVPQIRGSK